MQPTVPVSRIHTLVIPGAFLVLALFALFFVHPDAQAQNSRAEEAEERRAARRAEAEQMRASFEARAAALRADAASTTISGQVVSERPQLPEAAGARIRAVVAALTERLETGIERLETLAGRVETRALELEERGIEVDVALTYVSSARESLREASALLSETLPAEVSAALADDEPRAAFAYVKESMRAAAAHLGAAREALRSAVTALKEAVRTAGVRGDADAVRNNVQ